MQKETAHRLQWLLMGLTIVLLAVLWGFVISMRISHDDQMKRVDADHKTIIEKTNQILDKLP